MKELILTTLIVFIIMIVTGVYLNKKKKGIKFLFPIIGAIIGVGLAGYSIFVGNWTGMGLGIFGFSIFIGSALSIIILAFIDNAVDLKKHYFS